MSTGWPICFGKKYVDTKFEVTFSCKFITSPPNGTYNLMSTMSTYFFPEADGPPCSFILSTQEVAQEGSYLCSYQDTCHELTLNGSVVGSFDDIRKSTCIRPLTQGPFVRPSLALPLPPCIACLARSVHKGLPASDSLDGGGGEGKSGGRE